MEQGKNLVRYLVINMDAKQFELMVTLWPSMTHFPRFANDPRLSGIRLNSAMMSNPELDTELETIKNSSFTQPLFFDIKGRQLRIAQVNFNPDYLDIHLNHAISVTTPTMVLFKAGEDHALLERVEEDGKRLIFRGGPKFMVKAGESLHIRDKSLVVHGPLFTPEELIKIEKVKAAGFKKYYLSYVEEQSDVDQFEELVGNDSLIYLKIESLKGLDFVANQFKKKDNLVLVAARGDLYVEINRPHDLMSAMKLVIGKDPEAQVGSRMLLSLFRKPEPSPDVPTAKRYGINPVPSAADLLELAWMYDIGYRKALLCDEICLYDELLSVAVNVFDSFRSVYPENM